MSSEVDLQQLAIEREVPVAQSVRLRTHLLTRYVLPLALLLGFAAILGWAAWDLIFPPRPVTVIPVMATQAKVQQAGTTLFQAAGWIEPRPTPVRAPALAAGVVEQLLVVEDQPVEAGQPIAHLVRDDAQLSYEFALADQSLKEAELEQAKATHTAAMTRFEQPVHLAALVRQAEVALAGTQTMLNNLPFELRSAEARLKFAELDFQGKSSAKSALPGRTVDQASADLEAAQSAVESIRARKTSLLAEKQALSERRDALSTQLELLADEIQARDEAAAMVKAASAKVEQARVRAAEAKLQLDRMTVRAPVAGRVYQLLGEPGTRVSSNNSGNHPNYDSSTVVTLYRPKSLQVRVDVRFEDLPRVQLNQPARIANPALAEPLVGRVLFISSEADIQKNTLEVKVAIEDPPAVCKPAMLMDVTFLAPSEPQEKSESTDPLRLFVPRQLVLQAEQGSYVWLADRRTHVAHRQFVETGAVGADGMIEITRGLTVASRLIASSEGLEEGTRIRVTGEADHLTQGDTTAASNQFTTMNRLPNGEAH